MKASLLDAQATLYAEPDATSDPIARIGEEQHLEVTGAATAGAQRWVAAVLPDGRRGYLPGDTRIYGFHTVQLVKDHDVHADPSATSPVLVRYGRGATLLVLGITERDGRTWSRVRDGDDNEGYILTDASMADPRRVPPAVAAARRARRNMIVGGASCIGGTAVTLITYSAASGGGTYVVAWGAIVFGALQFFRGLVHYRGE